MNLYLRKVGHQQPHESYRVILKDDISEVEIGSISVTHYAGPDAIWVWGIDTVVPMRELESGGRGADRKDCQHRFKAAWEAFAADPARLADFMRMKRQRR